MARETSERPVHQVPEQETRPGPMSLGRVSQRNFLRNIGLILVYEYKKRLKQRSFIITTIIMLILIVLAACVPTVILFIGARSSSQTKLTIIDNAGTVAGMSSEQLVGYFDKALNGANTQKPQFAVKIAPAGNTVDTLKAQVQNGSIGILLVFNRGANQDLQFTYYTNAGPQSTGFDANQAQIQGLTGQLSLLDRAARLGLTSQQAGQLLAPQNFVTVNVGQTQGRSTSDYVVGIILGYVGVVLIFMTIYMYGYGVAVGVAEEKGNRIMEILVNAATPFQLMAGKIVGIGAAGLTQMVVFVVVGIAALLAQGPLQAALLGSSSGLFNLNIAGASISLLLLLLLYFLLGFLLYATIFAAVGALVNRQEEIQNAVQLPMWLFMIGYIVSFVGIANSNATWFKVISYIPFWTPTVMLMRINVGEVAWWEIVLTVAIMLVAIYVCTLIAARIYRLGVLMYGQKVGLGQAIKLIRAK